MRKATHTDESGMVLVFEQVWKIGATAEVCVLLCQRHRLRLPCTCCLLAVPAGCACCLLSVCWLLAAVPAVCCLPAGCWLPCLLAAGCWLPCLLPLPAGSASASWPPCRPNKACLPIVVHQLVAALLSLPLSLSRSLCLSPALSLVPQSRRQRETEQ